LLDAALQAEVEGRNSAAAELLRDSVDGLWKSGQTAPPNVLVHPARLHCLKGQFAAVERCARSGLRAFPQDFNLNNVLAIALWKLACSDEALAIAERAAKLNPRDVQPIATPAQIHSEKQDFERALALLEKANIN
jgi:tetratricopeptide (TPR) repeat protein